MRLVQDFCTVPYIYSSANVECAVRSWHSSRSLSISEKIRTESRKINSRYLCFSSCFLWNEKLLSCNNISSVCCAHRINIAHTVFKSGSSVISPALSHLRSLTCSSWGNSILWTTPTTQPADHRHDPQDCVASGSRTAALFKEPEQCVQVFPAQPLSHSSESSTRWHMIAARWACPLPFARAGVHNVHIAKGDAALRGCIRISAKVTEMVAAIANEDTARFMLTDCSHSTSVPQFYARQGGHCRQLYRACSALLKSVGSIFFMSKSKNYKRRDSKSIHVCLQGQFQIHTIHRFCGADPKLHPSS